MPEKTFDKKSADALAAAIRKNILRTIASKGSGHVGGSLSIADLLAVLYSGVMNVDPKNPQKESVPEITTTKDTTHCLETNASLLTPAVSTAAVMTISGMRKKLLPNRPLISIYMAAGYTT